MAQLFRAGLLLLLIFPFQAGSNPVTPTLGALSTIPVLAIDALPREARGTLKSIKRGGPFPYARDGAVFGNFERQLPRQPRGYYHEYTVKTPKVRNRGARRIVCGPLPECYYTDDHYQTFSRIQE